MKVLLLYPPITDPTSPYISMPYVKSYLNQIGVEAVQIDLNVAAADWLLSRKRLEMITQTAAQRFQLLNKKKRLIHHEKLEYLHLLENLESADYIINNIEKAKSFLRTDSPDFFNPEEYSRNITVINSSLSLVSSAYYPLSMDFSTYRSPFMFLNSVEIKRDSLPENNPFYDFYTEYLLPKIGAIKPDITGISVVFPSQLQPAWNLAWFLKKHFDIPLICGGPAITQLVVRQTEKNYTHLIEPFDAAVLFEAEEPLKQIAEEFPGKKPSGIIAGTVVKDLKGLPAPDFDGLDFELYFTNRIVLPYDVSRGCYWGRCAFCHYGLTESGTTPYRQRPAHEISEHLLFLKEKYKSQLFYFSQDTMSIPLALKLSEQLEGKEIYWATDMRAEKNLTAGTAKQLRKGGALAFSFGIESGSPRVLDSINKGISIEEISQAVKNSAAAGIATEAMCFTGFPGETGEEAILTLDFLKSHREHLSLFICGEFYLVAGSFIASHPDRFNIKEIFRVNGDHFKTGLFYIQEPLNTDKTIRLFDKKMANLTSAWFLNEYPWAASLSTAHTLIWYREKGKDCFKMKVKPERITHPRTQNYTGKPRFNLDPEEVFSIETELWNHLIYNERCISRDLYFDYSAMQKKASPIRK